ncbi:MAG TPA: phytanoyl-CoA dioxygenase family protein [Acidimicrobiales bacterium]|nr:phytanoyl-CoA dioxygenase family protein [Acidimicrobiales bacterium]
MAQLSEAQRRDFHETGYLAISGFFTDEELDWADQAYERVWRELPPDVVVDSEATGRRIRIENLTEEERKLSFKVNDLYLRDGLLRDAVISARLGAILAELLDDQPVVINTLSVEYGTQQADHLDTLFMTPRTPGALAATWMALEDVDDDAGPLRYYPGSNHIEPFRFSDGGYHVRNEEMPHWTEYMADSVDRRGLAESRFIAKRGDLFIWDAWLLHGGSQICTPGLSRRSLITHYFTRTDCKALQADLRPARGGWWMNRPPQAVADEAAQDTDPAIDELEDETGASVRSSSRRLRKLWRAGSRTRKSS